MKRHIDKQLTAWAASPKHKPLIVRGARQVGKTWSIRQLGQQFESFLEINFEAEPEIREIFVRSRNPVRLIEQLGAFFNTSIKPGKSLLFLDEIQACPEALQALRFFYEKMPELHVVAAGSLLEFALSELPSFGVGRIESLFMYPMSFSEFAEAAGARGMLDQVEQDPDNAPPIFHEELLNWLRTYMAVGGFPESVKAYLTNRDLLASAGVLDDLYTTFQDDFAKYRSRIPANRLDEVFKSVVMQAGGKFIYRQIDPEENTRVFKNAMSLLVMAGLVHLVYHTDAQGIPLGAQINPRVFKAIPIDVGLYFRILGRPLSGLMVNSDDDLVNKGAAAEIFAGTELIAAHSHRRRAALYYWRREKNQGNAELDYVIQIENQVVPVEVKSGKRGSMQSMQVFLKTHPKSKFGIRTSMEKFGRINSHILIRPLYALGNLNIC
jgi:predicted AAA+ superfamily ATPase